MKPILEDGAAGCRWLQTTGVVDAEFVRPTPNGCEGDDDPTFDQYFFNQARAQRKSKVQPQGVGDDLGWETMTFVPGSRHGHARPTTCPIAHSRLA